jgi:transposase
MVEVPLLVAYKRQTNLERCHHQLKSDLFVAPMFLRNPARFEGLMTCQFIALLVCSLVEQPVRCSMAERTATIVLTYRDDRPSSVLSAKRVFELLNYSRESSATTT